MKKIYFLLSFSLLSAASSFAQSTPWMAPDSAQVVAKSGSGPGPGWSYTNQLVHSGTDFTPAIMSTGYVNNKSDYLFLYDFGLSVPGTATITGVEVIIKRMGCNSGNYVRDTISLAHNGMAIGNYVADSVPASGATDTIGGNSDMWGNALTPAMVNSYTFGVSYSYESFGVCTFGIFDCRMKVHYVASTGVEMVAVSNAIRVYPNPATSVISIVSGNDDYAITDQLGRVVLTGSGTKADVSSLNSGLYFIRSGNETAKFIKQ